MVRLLLLLFLFNVGNSIVLSEKTTTSLSPPVKVEGSIKKEEEGMYKYEEPRRPGAISPFVTFVRAVVSLLVVVLLIYAVVYLLKLTWGKKPIFTPGAITVMDSFYLSQNKSIHILDIAGTIYIIGVSEKGMDLLKEVTDEVNINKIKSAIREKGTPSFKSYFSEFTKRFTGKREEIEGAEKHAFEGFSGIKESISKLRTWE